MAVITRSALKRELTTLLTALPGRDDYSSGPCWTVPATGVLRAA